jgi:hypothetical protein
MTKIDIFASAKEKTVPEWAKFTAAGDSYQGTYVGKIVGLRDGYGNEQIIYQLLQDDEKIINVGFGLNKKVLHKDMEPVVFGQIIGFRYKGTVSITDRRTGKQVDVKDFALHQDPKIVNATWLKENKDNMPEVVVSEKLDDSQRDVVKEAETAPIADPVEDLPFSSSSSLTNEDKIKVIEKLAKEKLGTTDLQTTKEKVMEILGIAFIPVQFDAIVEKLTKM